MKKILFLAAEILFLAFVLALAGCVTRSSARLAVLEAYRKGLQVGKVIGHDDILFKLKSPDCFNQTADQMSNYEYKSKIEKGNQP